MLTGGKNVIPHAVRDVADAAAAFSARIGPDRHFNSQENVEEALAECCSPQNVTVIGMTGSGKSSTLDALAGERFCSRVSSEATLVRWQYRPHPAPHTHEWVLDLFYPSDALLNLEFWDTIGLEQEDAPPEAEAHRPQIGRHPRGHFRQGRQPAPPVGLPPDAGGTAPFPHGARHHPRGAAIL